MLQGTRFWEADHKRFHNEKKTQHGTSRSEPRKIKSIRFQDLDQNCKIRSAVSCKFRRSCLSCAFFFIGFFFWLYIAMAAFLAKIFVWVRERQLAFLSFCLFFFPIPALSTAFEHTQNPAQKVCISLLCPQGVENLASLPGPPMGAAAGAIFFLQSSQPRPSLSDCASACEQDPISEKGSCTVADTQVAICDLSPLPPAPSGLISLRNSAPLACSLLPWTFLWGHQLLPGSAPGCCGPWLRLPCRESAPRVHFIPLLIPNILSIARAAQAHSKAQPALPPPVWGQ